MDPKDVYSINIEDCQFDVNNVIVSSIHSSSISSGNPQDWVTIDIGDPASNWINSFQKNEEWRKILHAAESNDALQKAVERVKILYYLSKEDGNSKT